MTGDSCGAILVTDCTHKATLPVKRYLAGRKGMNYYTHFSLRRRQHFGEDDNNGIHSLSEGDKRTEEAAVTDWFVRIAGPNS
jgi:hypothetical protein